MHIGATRQIRFNDVRGCYEWVYTTKGSDAACFHITLGNLVTVTPL